MSASAEPQTSDAVLMVRPVAFGFNPETAASNAFARDAASGNLRVAAEAEFDRVAHALDRAGIEVVELADDPDPPRPDAIFPNNWVSFHADGTRVLYPMAAPTRRLERCPARLASLLAERGFEVRRTIDLSSHEAEGRFLEGTGSLILDRPNRRAFASRSPRTDPTVIAEFDRESGYSSFLFDAFDRGGRAIYHTNVILSLGTGFAAACLEAVPEEQRGALVEALEASGRTIIDISFEQASNLACNILELRSRSGEAVIAMSDRGRRSLRPDQLREFERFGSLVGADIPTIETVGGGGIRCMIADIHLPRKSVAG